MRLAVLLLTFGFAALQPGVRDGRAGNERLEAADVDGAVTAYTNGTLRDGVPPGVAMRLWHNLGVALARDTTEAPGLPPDSAGAPEAGSEISADSAFAQALRLADDPDTRARYAYDAGTAALIAGDIPLAVGLLRRSLVLDPSRREARRNYEIARRQLRDPEAPPTPPEPSDEAKRIKAEADRLVAERRYRDALDVMSEGLARDSTVAAYADFTGRLGEVVDIEEMPVPGDEARAPETTAPRAPVPAPTPAAPRPAFPAGPTRL